MTEPFILTVPYQGTTRDFSAQLLLVGYTHRFKVLIGQQEVFFEPDEEGIYRAISPRWEDREAMGKIDKQLLFAIQQQLESIRK